ncbi:MAG: DUF2723 domain-containing protein [Prolixibacteraceae bacterium]|nr:DUF2723 domain-containing protein [Prolixibacteraceae bacterium]
MYPNKKINILLGWAVFAISFIVYLLTLEPTASFWDCGEFIAAAYKLQVPHPPGAPFFLLVQRAFSLVAPSAEYVAYAMNAFSALASATTVMFLYWTIVNLILRFAKKSSSLTMAGIYASGLIGALAFAFTDTFWFSAVESEVYAFSSLFTAVVFWAILRWEQEAGEPRSNRWILLIAYLMGLSIGVHLLNLLAIPAIALIWYFKKYKTNTKGTIATLVLSGAAILFIMYGIVQGTPAIARKIEILFVNALGLPFNSGLLFFIALLMALLSLIIVYSHRARKPGLNLLATSLLLIYIGFGSYAMIMIRSAANPPMDENNPENAYMLMNYLNRTQYGKTPLISGHYYNAPTVGVKPGKANYYPGEDRYVKVDGQPEYQYDSRFKTIFPRMYSSQSNHVHGYNMWGKINGNPVKVNGKTKSVPTFGENFRFFISYQLSYMYFRYFMWNFSGRQNDNQGHGSILNGNWLSGIPFIDNARLGHNGLQPSSMSNPETTNRYYMLPLLLGLIGAFFHYKKNAKDFWVVALLFFMTGIAIVLYLNQPPYQPRERDYAYVGSFYAFSIWIGLGVSAVTSFFNKTLKRKAYIPASIICMIVPVLLLAENYNDHDRSGRYFVRDLGKNYLNTCAPNSILFTYGDNDTFPLWYVQDVEDERPDVRICNVTLLNSDWYIDQMKQKVYDSDPLPISMTSDKYEYNKRNVVLVRNDIKRPLELSKLMQLALSDNKRAQLQTRDDSWYNYFPTNKFKITVDKQQVLKTNTVSNDQVNNIADSIIIEYQGQYLTKSDLAILDMLAGNNWERPLYFDMSVVETTSLSIKPYLQNEGFAYRFVPIHHQPDNQPISTEKLYQNLVHRFEWGNLGSPDIFIGENLRNTIHSANIKSNFHYLASSLTAIKQEEKALETIDKLYSILPLGRYETNRSDVAMASVYYHFQKQDKADHLIETVANERLANIRFYLSLGENYIDRYQQQIEQDSNVLNEALSLLEKNQRVELSTIIEQQLDEVLSHY